MKNLIATLFLCASFALASTTNIIVQVSTDGAQTIPPNTIATPAQVADLGERADGAVIIATNNAAAVAAAADRVRLYSTNYVVTSTVYVQSVGGVPYDPSNQTIRVLGIYPSSSNVVIVGSVRQLPLVPPKLDWRQQLNTGGWSNINATVTQIAIPEGVTNAVACYSFTLPRPSGGSAYFRIVDNSSGASGSGLYWVVFGAIYVDGHKGWTGTITNVVGSVTNYLPVHGGIHTEPTPIGGL